ncbi:MAG: LuxR family transcriptional regulator, partial [Syntrophaceae bacterium]|nr:LuxR family transcriptional regulator [Syntrophaceae bacterium]
KEIAQLRGVSVATINRHREHIRRKLKIANCEVNLTTYLQSIR